MRDDCGYDPHWWKAEKAASLARKREQQSASAWAKPGDAFLIVTEGTVAEPVYFELLRRDLELSAIRIQVLPGEASDPRRVIEMASREAKAQELRAKRGQLRMDEPERFDQVWAVIDTDVAVRQGHWNDVRQLAAARKVKLAHSSPCFEFWLLLHLRYNTHPLVDGAAAKSAFKHALGQDYAKNAATTQAAIELLIPKWPAAVANAERVSRHHEQAATPEPANPSSEVWQLATAMNDSTPEYQRKERS